MIQKEPTILFVLGMAKVLLDLQIFKLLRERARCSASARHNLLCVGDHPFKTSACLREGEGCPHGRMVKRLQYIRIKNPLHKHFAGMLTVMAVRVVEFSNGVYKIRKIFA